jgi:hypothetical protein
VSDKILQALQQLDATDDGQWTQDGLPKLDVVARLAGVEKVGRQEVVNLAPQLNRENLLAALHSAATGEPPAEPAGPTLDDELARLQAAADAASAAVAEQERLIAAEQRKLAELQRASDRAGDAVVALVGSTARQREAAEIRRWLDSQARQREERAAKHNAVFAGVDLRSIQRRSPLDTAMARKVGGGSTARPAVLQPSAASLGKVPA